MVPSFVQLMKLPSTTIWNCYRKIKLWQGPRNQPLQRLSLLLTCGHRRRFCKPPTGGFALHLIILLPFLWQISWPVPCHRTCKRREIKSVIAYSKPLPSACSLDINRFLDRPGLVPSRAPLTAQTVRPVSPSGPTPPYRPSTFWCVVGLRLPLTLQQIKLCAWLFTERRPLEMRWTRN